MFKNKYRVAVDYFKKRTELEKFLLILVSLALLISFIYALPAILDLLFKMVVLLLIALPIVVWFGLSTKSEEVYYDTSKLSLCFKQIVSRLDSDSKNRYLFQNWQVVRASKKKTARVIELVCMTDSNVEDFNSNEVEVQISIYLSEFLESHGMTSTNAEIFLCKSVAVAEYNNVNYLFIRFLLAVNENEANSFEKELDVYKAKQEKIARVEDSDFGN
ncbi:hypothetical protein [Streptococcus sp. CF10-1]|jgi:hypothetical protein|uniref:hypothetical protein n=1 Tax=Streptococcus sp. CF10-1 TaxID=2963162 RepID=UPI0020C8CCC1|nr:hypothetical protein [Streptococcus sp. CF10-1]MCP9083457.1 hypothetical protein [Streptococcus sp. CF10-1]